MKKTTTVIRMTLTTIKDGDMGDVFDSYEDYQEHMKEFIKKFEAAVVDQAEVDDVKVESIQHFVTEE